MKLRWSVQVCSIDESSVFKSLQITAAKDGESSVVKKSLEVGVDPDAKEKDKVQMHASRHLRCKPVISFY